MKDKMNCLVCNKQIDIGPEHEVIGGIRVHVDIDDGSKFMNLHYRMEMSKKQPIP